MLNIILEAYKILSNKLKEQNYNSSVWSSCHITLQYSL